MKRAEFARSEDRVSNKRTESLRREMESLTEEERGLVVSYLARKLGLLHPLEQEWGTDTGAILTATQRAPKRLQRNILQSVMKQVFERDALTDVTRFGWEALPLPPGDPPYDFLLRRRERQARIQLKLQRIESGQPKRYRPRVYPDPLYVVEVQRTRSGTRGGEATRPYRFGDFDILAVCMQPVTKRWHDFRYTVEKWLLPRKLDNNLIEIFEPVSLAPNELWTDRLEVCLEWFLARRRVRTFSDVYRAETESPR